jgi:hypothetical protein
MRPKLLTSAVLACLSAWPPAEAQVAFTQIKEFSVPEANQGVGVDKDHFYAVDNEVIAKYNKHTGQLVDRFENPPGGGITHKVVAFRSNIPLKRRHRDDDHR